ncbi:hypothetical protein OHB26_05805 [Nocardia sp. NBC_01503]|uniref:hypothetical protein n=1 Tax=Nocardia sp. NBC_01503 TaxID=2975997 RepID=UPI002E7B390E|nr:hypothetical protein [Nocardia sp. NBC_01503]WTL33738.1 hypothetical protein OHB26_05805 [Nocardia sp. NBC_01503]
MSLFPSVLSAIAATVAAVLAGLNLYLSGRREQRKWIREALIDAYVQYLGASFRGGSRKLRGLRSAGAASDILEQARQKLEEAHTLQNENLTRLRLIAPENVVRAAEALHTADHLAWDVASSPDQSNDSEWRRSREAQREARHRFINEARRSLDLGPGTSIARYE